MIEGKGLIDRFGEREGERNKGRVRDTDCAEKDRKRQTEKDRKRQTEEDR